jgi:hypothetical protein
MAGVFEKTQLLVLAIGPVTVEKYAVKVAVPWVPTELKFTQLAVTLPGVFFTNFAGMALLLQVKYIESVQVPFMIKLSMIVWVLLLSNSM